MNLKITGKLLTLCLVGTFSGSVFAAVEAPYEVGTWENFCTGAVTHTFDDNMNTNPSGDGQKIFDEKGFHMSVCVQSGSANWTNCKATFAKGHEISNHTVSHNSTVSEMNTAQTAIRKNVPGEMCITIAYPNCNTPGDAEVLKTHYAGRNCDGKTASSSPSNMAQISSKMFGAGSCGCPNDANSMNTFADAAVSSKGWSVYCHHGIGSESHSWAVTNLNAVKSHLDYLDKNRDKIWIETFGNVTRYIKERNAASVAKKDSTDKAITITVTDNLVDSLFNYPLTIRRPLPDGWTTAVVTQKNLPVEDSIITVSSKKYVMFKAVPDGGDVVISKDIVATNQSYVRFANRTVPVIRQQTSLLINSSRFNGASLSIGLFNLSGKLITHYVIPAGQTCIGLPAEINRTAFVAKVSGGGNSWNGILTPQM